MGRPKRGHCNVTYLHTHCPIANKNHEHGDVETKLLQRVNDSYEQQHQTVEPNGDNTAVEYHRSVNDNGI